MTLIIRPDWPAPGNVVALTTTRDSSGDVGHSKPPYDTWNLGCHVGDEPAVVDDNRESLMALLPQGTSPCWLQQVHGTRAVEAGSSRLFAEADAAWSRSEESACVVLTADCLPVLFCSQAGDVVAAAHAGWRGLAAGILERTVEAMGCDPGRLMAWMGPAIGPQAFEVGPEVRDQFLEATNVELCERAGGCFRPSERRSGHFYADLYELARIRLENCGLHQIYGGGFCTYADAQRFYSYRRDGKTGRMASLIALAGRPQNS
jgi:YfiH family protein